MALQKAFTITQGGADTAAETTIATNIQPGITYGAWELLAVEFTISPDLMKAWAGADTDFTLQITKRTLAGSITRLVTYTDNDLIASWSLAAQAQGTPANWVLNPATYNIQFPPGVILYGENMYVQAISAGSGQTNIVWGRLFYDIMTLTPAQALAVIASRP